MHSLRAYLRGIEYRRSIAECMVSAWRAVYDQDPWKPAKRVDLLKQTFNRYWTPRKEELREVVKGELPDSPSEGEQREIEDTDKDKVSFHRGHFSSPTNTSCEEAL